MKRQVAVLGLGRFGSAVARELTRLGHDVLAIDASEKIAQDLAPEVSLAVQADITDEDALRDLGLGQFDTAIVAVSSHLEVSILATTHLERLGVRRIVAKAANKLHGSILLRVGAGRVVYPEEDTGIRLAHSFAAPSVLDYLDAAPGYGLARIPVHQAWINQPLGQLDLPGSCGVTPILLSRGADVILGPDRSEVLRAGDALIVAGRDEDLERLPAAESQAAAAVRSEAASR
jgi:trk system potassium uptake protein TrkA